MRVLRGIGSRWCPAAFPRRCGSHGQPLKDELATRSAPPPLHAPLHVNTCAGVLSYKNDGCLTSTTAAGYAKAVGHPPWLSAADRARRPKKGGCWSVTSCLSYDVMWVGRQSHVGIKTSAYYAAVLLDCQNASRVRGSSKAGKRSGKRGYSKVVTD